MENIIEIDQEGQSYWAGLWTDKQRRHQYLSRVYQDLFATYLDRHVDILEIGSAHGGSLLLWARWFASCSVTGVDIHNNLGAAQFIPELLEEKFSNIHNYHADAYSALFHEKLGSFDIIIEDAAHTEQQMMDTLGIYLPHLRPNGLLTIEDIDPDQVRIDLLQSLCAGRRTEVRDLRAYTGTRDSVVLVVYN
jgi:SAM-dependent methyltransferase